MRLFLSAGARRAGNGEFSKRAFLNGKMDIAQAESVIDLIEAESEREAAVALRHMKGTLSEKIEQIRQELLGLAAQILAFIDYPDDEIGELSQPALNGGLQHALEALCALEQSFSVGKLVKNGLKVSIVGKPNVGKSRVMNRILGYERSIVTDIAGTTRDIVEDTAVFGGWKLILSDTAGIRETENPVEKIGVAKTEEAVSGADLLLCVFDGSRPADAEDERVLAFLEQTKTAKIALINKSDLKRSFDGSVLKGFETVLWVSAKENEGFAQLSDAVKTLFETNDCGQNAEIITNERQYACIAAARGALQQALENAAVTADARLLDIEQAIEELSAFTGKSVSEQIVETIFSRFCVGK